MNIPTREELLRRAAARMRVLIREARRLVQEEGATHDCGEWPTADHRCALCDRLLSCYNYAPDANGECLNCDEPGDAHPRKVQ